MAATNEGWSDYLWVTVPGGAAAVKPGVYVRLVSNADGVTGYVSAAMTDANGRWAIAAIPPGAYTVYYGPAATGPWTPTGDTDYVVAPDLSVAAIIPLTAVAGVASDALVAHLAGAEAFTGVKTFTANPVFNAGAIPLAALTGAAADAAVVHLAGAEILTGPKTLQASGPAIIPLVVQGAAAQTADLQRWLKSDGTVLASVDASGNMTVANLNLGSGGNLQGSGLLRLTSNGNNPTSLENGNTASRLLMPGSFPGGVFQFQPGSNGAFAVSTEAPSVAFNANTLTIGAAFTNQRFHWFRQATISAASPLAIGGKAATVAIEGAPLAAGLATLATPLALWVQGGGVEFDGAVGFNGTVPVGKQTLTGAKGGNAALASVIAAMVAYGLALDNTTA